ncbi:MAG: hypothetical protein ABIQ35_09370 [Verrucomicrobiota bacterium]
MKLKHPLLALSLVSFVAGFNPSDTAFWGVGLPLGAILLGGFMILSVLEKEMALYDGQQRDSAPECSRFETALDSPPKRTNMHETSGSIFIQQAGAK